MTRPVVVKVGGSLLDWPGLAVRLREFLDRRLHDRIVLVVGGGRFADLVRELDEAHQLGEDCSHGLALHTMDLTARVLVALVHGLDLVDTLDDLPVIWSRARVPVLSVQRFLGLDDRSADPLPHAWTTTSDSIAARLAVRLEASELVLLKSAALPPGCTTEDAARLGLVDAEFPRVSASLIRVSYFNLRDPRGLEEHQLIGTDPRDS